MVVVIVAAIDVAASLPSPCARYRFLAACGMPLPRCRFLAACVLPLPAAALFSMCIVVVFCFWFLSHILCLGTDGTNG